ncbi:MAG TPA: DUF6754 domain-containing protein [Candidatus Eisenbacteria bacterium]|nr:DUF6754 domain-containing protein [Candidatus Eisenbacteria bacterium]
MRWAVGSFLLAVLFTPAAVSAQGAAPPSPPASTVPTQALPAPTNFVAQDNPGDSGGSILLTWTDPDSAALPAGSVIEIRRAEAPAFDWKALAEVPLGTQTYKDASATEKHTYRYELRARAPAAPADTTRAAAAAASAAAAGTAVVSEPASAHDNWFRKDRTNSLIATIIFLIALLGSIQMAHSGKPIFIRRIAGLNAVDEAIGRATETGRKVLYVPGIQSMDDIQTVASMSILGHVARATARYGTDLDVANKDPLTFASARETVRGAYLAEGRPDLYREEMVNYVTYDQFAFTAAVSARMVRERPATIFLVGYFFAESLILAETGQSVGAIQIAGQADPTQLPFFVATCDYTLIGEELYAASAYLSREPVLLGSIRGQDIFKALCIVVGLAGIAFATFGSTWVAKLLQTQ